MAERILKIIFHGDASNAEKAFKATGDAADGLGSKVKGLGSHFADMGKLAGGFVLGEGLLKAPGFLLDAAKGAAEDEAATARLNQALDNLASKTGASADELAGWHAAVDEAIAKGQKLAFSDDDVRDSFQSLLAATGDIEEALKRQRAAMDLARGANLPLATATKILGKLNAENVEVFKKLGITLGDNATEADALAAVQARFGGQAEKFAKSTAGQFEQAKIAMGEIVEGIGGAVLPVLTLVGTELAKALPYIQEFVGGLGEKVASVVAPAVEALSGVLADVVGWIADHLAPALADLFAQDIAPKIEAVRAAFEAIAPKIGEVAAAIADRLQPIMTALGDFLAGHKEILAAVAIVIGGALVAAFAAWAVSAAAAAAATLIAIAPVIAIGLALTALVAGIIFLVKNWGDLEAKYPILQSATDALKAAFEAFAGWITGTFVPAVMVIAKAVEEAASKSIGFVRDHWDEIRAVIEPAVKAVAEIIRAAWEQARIYIETAIGVIEGIIDVFVGVFTGDWGRAKDGVLKIVDALKDGLVNTITNAIELVKGLAPLILSAGEALGGALLDGLKSALSATAGFAGDVADAVLRAVKSVINNFVIGPINRALEFTIPIPGAPDIHIDPPDIHPLARGLWEVPGPRGAGDIFPALLAPGEMVVPEAAADRLRAGAGAGAGGLVVNIYGPVIARDEHEARQTAGDLGALVMARLRAKGVA